MIDFITVLAWIGFTLTVITIPARLYTLGTTDSDKLASAITAGFDPLSLLYRPVLLFVLSIVWLLTVAYS